MKNVCWPFDAVHQNANKPVPNYHLYVPENFAANFHSYGVVRSLQYSGAF